ncbi:MAG: class I SAM-dependent methyltransferase [Tissierellia bacterium]|nr:class I SAM-dependent methyltransferase [Tissierellia bacterium]
MNQVQETLFYPLVTRTKALEKWPHLFSYHSEKDVIHKSPEGTLKNEDYKDMVFFITGFRHEASLQCLKEYIQKHPNCTVVNLGCGLADLYPDVDNGTIKYYNVDYPEVIKVRENIMDKGEREINIPSSLTNHTWMDSLIFKKEEGIIFIAIGVIYYLQVEEGKAMIRAMAEKFPGGRFIFDSESPEAMTKSQKQMEKKGIHEAPLVFRVENYEDILHWSPQISKVNIIYMDKDLIPQGNKIPLSMKLMFKAAKMKKFFFFVEIDF